MLLASLIAAALGIGIIRSTGVASHGAGVASQESCWPTGHMPFAGASRQAVLDAATAFLSKQEKVALHPYWPGGASGITLGVGWDAGYHTTEQLRETWSELDEPTLRTLAGVSGQRGAPAHDLLPRVIDLQIPETVSQRVLASSLSKTFYPLVQRLFSTLDQLPLEAQVVMISVVFNRGPSIGQEPDWHVVRELDRRWEMRRMQVDVKEGDLFGIYAHLGTMKRLWESHGPRGLPLRRRDEQALIRPLVDRQLLWEAHRDELKAAGLPACGGDQRIVLDGNVQAPE
jgi:hypothetical protein